MHGDPQMPSRDATGARSIAVEFSLLIGGLLIVGASIGAVVTYSSARDASMSLSVQRLASVTAQLRDMLDANGAQYRQTMRAVADMPAVRAFIRTPDAARRAEVARILAPSADIADQVATREIRSASDSLLVAVGDVQRWADPAVDRALVRAAIRTDADVIGPFSTVGDSVLFAVAAPVRVGRAPKAVYVQWFRLRSSPQARAQLNALIGPGARLSIGGTEGKWTDLGQAVPAPPVPIDTATGVLEYDRPGTGPVVAMARRVPGTPWSVLVEFTRAAALGGAVQFLQRLALITGILLIVLLAGTWLAIGRLVRPLAALTSAAEAVAEGRLDGRVGGERRNDEIGRLAGAFDAMVARVREARDELERRVTERTRELKERNEELEAFGYSLAHDLRAPLRAMQGFSQALLEDHASQLDPTGRHYAELVSDGARTMDRMILDLLNYSRIARAELQPAPVELTAVIGAATRQLKRDLTDRHSRISVAPGLPSVLAHEATLVQVFANLIGNASKFVPPDRTPEVRISTIPWNGAVRVWVEDNGIGIPPQFQQKIFGVFERLNGADEYPGTGIGLAIVRKAMEKMGGAVGVESIPGTGSRFWIELPALEVKGAA